MPGLLRAAAREFCDRPAVMLKGTTIPDDALSFAELERQSALLARGLIARGVGKGTRIGFIQGNGPGFALMLAAISRIGAIAIPISTLIKSNELVRVMRRSDIAGLIAQRSLLGHDYVDRLCAALPELAEATGPDLRLAAAPYLRWILSSGEGLPPAIGDVAGLSDAAESVNEELLEAIESEVHPTDQMLEIYTSGSMALPKGVKHNHGPVMFRARYLASMVGRERRHNVPVPLPMFWVGGLIMYLLPNLTDGSTTVCTEGTSTSSRMAMGSVLADDDMKAMAQVPPYWGLGMTETIGPYSYGDVLRVPGYPLCAPLDHIAEGYEVRIATDAGREVTEGVRGEIQVRGIALTPGLHKVEREGYFTDDGYYRTGDMGLREGSRIHFVGRDGDMIKTGGSNVSPAEVELEMQQIDGVHSAYVVGIPDAERGQLVVAAVVPREGAELDFGQIEAELRGRLSGYKVPRAYIALTREEVPTLHSNKVARREIERMMGERLGHA